MRNYITSELRSIIVDRANHHCEYCLIHRDDTFFGCEVDHIISLKHGGNTEVDNLAYACVFCNRLKGSDIGSIGETNEFIRFYNPRKDQWNMHFQLESAIIKPLTGIGEVTIRIFGFNKSERILERQALIDIGRYPSIWALAQMRNKNL